jgi:hypothetical protein
MYQPGDEAWFYAVENRRLKPGIVRQVTSTSVEKENEDDEIIDRTYYVVAGYQHITVVNEYELFESKENFIATVLG